MAATATLDATGRDMMNAINAGKAVMVRAVEDGTTYFVMPSITFVDSDGADHFLITFSLGNDTYNFSGSLDDTIVCLLSGGVK